MKKYVKPDISLNNIKTDNIASLNDWLNDNNLNDAGITTYVINS